jgi:hypothetical protein
MDHFAGLDVSVKETSVCIVDETGRIVREVKMASEPEALLPMLKNPAYHFKRIGTVAGDHRPANEETRCRADSLLSLFDYTIRNLQLSSSRSYAPKRFHGDDTR